LPNLPFLATSYARLEPGPLPSAGITRLHRYCRPLRHPRAPRPSLAGVRLVILHHAMGLPVLRALALVYMLSPIPRRGSWDHRFCSCSPNHVSLPRKEGRVGPRIVLFEACSAFTRVTACTLATSPYFVTRWSPEASTVSLPPQLLRLLPAGAACRVGLSPTGKAPPFHGAPAKRSSTRHHVRVR